MVDGPWSILVFGEIGLPSRNVNWKTAMRQRAMSAREVLARHRVAIGRWKSATHAPVPRLCQHHKGVLGCLRQAGFSIALAAHAYSVLDSYPMASRLQQASLPFQTADRAVEVADGIRRAFPAMSIRI